MVDDVLASCYPSADHDVSHFVIAPIRWFPQIIEWTYGVDNGCQISIKVVEELGRWMLPQELLYF